MLFNSFPYLYNNLGFVSVHFMSSEVINLFVVDVKDSVSSILHGFDKIINISIWDEFLFPFVFDGSEYESQVQGDSFFKWLEQHLFLHCSLEALLIVPCPACCVDLAR